jgi:apolipoprotein D and lipocalin family protein
MIDKNALSPLAFAVAIPMIVAGCASSSNAPPTTPVTLASQVDLQRFMGDWYVIANIPTRIEEGAFNSKDSYRLDADGTVATTFSFNADGYTGPRKSYDSRGYVVADTNNAVWGQQYVWPIKADYRISYLSADYKYTVIARDKRDYVWIMSRTPTMPDAELERLKAFVKTQGYDVSKLQKVPQASGV